MTEPVASDPKTGTRTGQEETQIPGTLKIGINQVEYSNTPDGPIIHIFGRDENGQALHLQVTGFKPYFYVPAGEADGQPVAQSITADRDNTYYSIHREPLRRFYTQRPGDVRELREKYRHCEADIPFATRFLIDSGLTGGVEAPDPIADYRDLKKSGVSSPARVCMLDIECEDERGFPEPERDRIICLTAWDSFDDHYTSFVSSPTGDAYDFSARIATGGLNNGCFAERRHSIFTYAGEKAMLGGFIDYIRKTDPDILSGWNFVDFDMPYIAGRMEAIGLNATRLSRLSGQTERNAVRGRALFDLLSGYKKMQLSERESYRLDAIAQAELGDAKVRYKGGVSDLWKSDPELLVEYNFKDVELCVRINQKNSIVEFYREIARYVGCPLDRTLNSSNVIDIYILRKAHGRYVLPSKGSAAANEFEGATVFDPSRGLRSNVVVLDLKSLYPMAMMTINASPETKDPGGELRAPNGIRFRKEPDGLTRSIIAELLGERDEKKRQRNLYAFGSPEYVLLDLQQNVLKVIMNTYYGVSGYTRFRLYDREIGSAVTSVGRAIIEHTRAVIEKSGYRVIYGDTDSCMVQLPAMGIEETIAAARVIEKELNESYGEFAKRELNAGTHFFSIKFEKIYGSFFQAGKKKRYAGHLTWKEGKIVDEIDIVGFEIRRSDYPQITKRVQMKVMEMILHGEPFEGTRSYLGTIIKDYRSGRYSLDEIGIPGGIGKQLADYDIDDAHIRGAKYANQHLGMEFSKGSKPKRVYIKGVKSKYPRTDVLCFEYGDQVPPEFTIDYEMMLDKTIRQPISRIIEALGWNWASIDPSRTTLAQFGLG